MFTAYTRRRPVVFYVAQVSNLAIMPAADFEMHASIDTYILYIIIDEEISTTQEMAQTFFLIKNNFKKPF